MEAVGATMEQHLPHVARLYRAGVTLLPGTEGDDTSDVTGLQRPRVVVSRGREVALSRSAASEDVARGADAGPARSSG